jgi:hypothetical protein
LLTFRRVTKSSNPVPNKFEVPAVYYNNNPLPDTDIEIVVKIKHSARGLADAPQIDGNGLKMAVAKRVDADGKRVDTFAKRVDAHGKRLDAVAKRVDALAKRVGKRWDAMAKRVNTNSKLLDAMDKRHNAMDKRRNALVKLCDDMLVVSIE